jgi:hypothetical protein
MGKTRCLGEMRNPNRILLLCMSEVRRGGRIMSFSWVRRPDAVVESEEDGEKRRESMRTSYNNDPVYFYNSRGGIIITMTSPCDVCGEEMVSDCGGYWTLNDSYEAHPNVFPHGTLLRRYAIHKKPARMWGLHGRRRF